MNRTTWHCTVCTLENPISKRRCQVCETRRTIIDDNAIIENKASSESLSKRRKKRSRNSVASLSPPLSSKCKVDTIVVNKDDVGDNESTRAMTAMKIFIRVGGRRLPGRKRLEATNLPVGFFSCAKETCTSLSDFDSSPLADIAVLEGRDNDICRKQLNNPIMDENETGLNNSAMNEEEKKQASSSKNHRLSLADEKTPITEKPFVVMASSTATLDPTTTPNGSNTEENRNNNHRTIGTTATTTLNNDDNSDEDSCIDDKALEQQRRIDSECSATEEELQPKSSSEAQQCIKEQSYNNATTLGNKHQQEVVNGNKDNSSFSCSTQQQTVPLHDKHQVDDDDVKSQHHTDETDDNNVDMSASKTAPLRSSEVAVDDNATKIGGDAALIDPIGGHVIATFNHSHSENRENHRLPSSEEATTTTTATAKAANTRCSSSNSSMTLTNMDEEVGANALNPNIEVQSSDSIDEKDKGVACFDEPTDDKCALNVCVTPPVTLHNAGPARKCVTADSPGNKKEKNLTDLDTSPNRDESKTMNVETPTETINTPVQKVETSIELSAAKNEMQETASIDPIDTSVEISSIARSMVDDLTATNNSMTASMIRRNPLTSNFSSPLSSIQEAGNDLCFRIHTKRETTEEMSSLSPPALAKKNPQSAPIRAEDPKDESVSSRTRDQAMGGYGESKNNPVSKSSTDAYSDQTSSHSNKIMAKQSCKDSSQAAFQKIGSPSVLDVRLRDGIPSTNATPASPPKVMAFRYTPPSQEDDERGNAPPIKRTKRLPSHGPSVLRKNLEKTRYNVTGNTRMANASSATGKKILNASTNMKSAIRSAVGGNMQKRRHYSLHPEKPAAVPAISTGPVSKRNKMIKYDSSERTYRSTLPVRRVVIKRDNRALHPTIWLQTTGSSDCVVPNTARNMQNTNRYPVNKHSNKETLKLEERNVASITSDYASKAQSETTTSFAETVFCTAGSAQPIHVSAEYLERASSLLETASTPKAAMLCTAGSNKSIQASSEDIQRIGSLWKTTESSDASPTQQAAAPIKFHSVGSNQSIHASTSNMEWASSLLESNKAPTAAGMFYKAGSNQPIHVSSEDIRRADSLFKTPEPPKTNTPSANIRAAGSDRSIHVSTKCLQRAKNLLELARTPLPAAPFHTRGTNQSTHVSNDNLKQASSLLESNNEPLAAMFRTAGTSRSIHVSKDTLKQTSSLLESSNEPPAAMVRSVGTSRSIHVSKDNLEQASTILESCHEPPVAMFRTAGLQKSIQVTAKNLQRATDILESAKEPHAAMFHTSELNHSIHVASENIEQAGRLLNGHGNGAKDNLEPKPGFTGGADPMVSTKAVGWEAKTNSPEELPAIQVSAARINLAKFPSASFRKAGSDRSIIVSDENLRRANCLLNSANAPPVPMFGSNQSTNVTATNLQRANSLLLETNTAPAATFCTAGTGNSIHVSAESIQRTKSLLEPEDTPAFAMFRTAGSNQSIHLAPENMKRANKSFVQFPITCCKAAFNDSIPKIESTENRPEVNDSEATLGSRTSVKVIINKKLETESIDSQNCSDGRKVTDVVGYTSERNSTSNSEFSSSSTEGTISCTSTPSSHAQLLEFKTTNGESLYIRNTLPFGDVKEAPTLSSESISSASAGDAFDTIGESASKKNGSRRRAHFIVSSRAEEGLVGANDLSERAVRSAPITPLPNNFSTPHVRWGSIQNAMYGITPKPTMKSDSPEEYRYPATPLPISPFKGAAGSEVLAEIGRTPQVTIMRQPTSKVTLSGGHRAAQRFNHASGQSKKMFTPVPISFVGKDSRDKASHNIHSDSTQDIPHPENVVKANCNQTLEDAAKNGDLTSEPTVCLGFGVHKATLLVNSLNATSLLLSSTTGLPVGFLGEEDNPRMRVIGSAEDYRNGLLKKGCKSDLVSETWVSNHLRWIIWKLAAYERRFAPYLGGTHLAWERILLSLKVRYEKELVQGYRPALRKVLNGDVAARRTMILVVAQVFPKTATGPSEKGSPERGIQNTKIELSDGWYSVPAKLDAALSAFVRTGLIKVGTKMVVSSGRLVGAEDGIDPLDDGFCPSESSCTVSLVLSANATRLAKWNSKLGFVRNSPSHTPKGLLLTKRISDIIPDGGSIPVVRFVVMRRYPLLYYEKGGSGGDKHDLSSPRSSFLTATEEERRRIDHEKRFTKKAEKLTEQLEAEITKEIDEGAPETWKRIMHSSSPEDCFEALNEREKSQISRWKQTRSELISRRVQLEVQAEMEVDESMTRKSTRLIRMKVRSICFSKASKIEDAILTIWDPNEDQLDLEEGAAIQFENLSVSSSRQDGLIQLTATGRTLFERYTNISDSTLHARIGFTKRRFLNLFQIYCTSRKAASENKPEGEQRRLDFDAVGFVVKISKSDTGITIYVSDESKLMLRIHCKSAPFGMEFHRERVRPTNDQCNMSGQVYGFLDLKLMGYDEEEDCVLAQFSDNVSSLSKSGERVDVLRQRLADDPSKFSHLVRYSDIDLPVMERPVSSHAIGYIIGLKAAEKGKLHIEVDCGSSYKRQEWELPVRCLDSMVPVAAQYQQAVLMPEEEDRIDKLGVLGQIYRARGLLWRFRLSPKANSLTNHVVEDVTKADVLKLAYLSAS